MHTLSYHSKLHHLINDSIYKDQVVPYAAYHGRKMITGMVKLSSHPLMALRPWGQWVPKQPSHLDSDLIIHPKNPPSSLAEFSNEKRRNVWILLETFSKKKNLEYNNDNDDCFQLQCIGPEVLYWPNLNRPNLYQPTFIAFYQPNKHPRKVLWILCTLSVHAKMFHLVQ